MGSFLVVGKFDLIKPLRLIDLSALQEIASVRSELLDPKTYQLEQQAIFLDQLSRKISKPIHPHEAEIEYITTQVVAEYLGKKFDGLIFNSAQKSDKQYNVVLFHSSSRIEQVLPQSNEEIDVHLYDSLNYSETMRPQVVTWKDTSKKSSNDDNTLLDNPKDYMHADKMTYVHEPCLKLDRENIVVSEIQEVAYKYSSGDVSFSTYDKNELEF